MRSACWCPPLHRRQATKCLESARQRQPSSPVPWLISNYLLYDHRRGFSVVHPCRQIRQLLRLLGPPTQCPFSSKHCPLSAPFNQRCFGNLPSTSVIERRTVTSFRNASVGREEERTAKGEEVYYDSACSYIRCPALVVAQSCSDVHLKVIGETKL